jgi:DNA-directed RNA polymerase specialized sigma24 family protein
MDISVLFRNIRRPLLALIYEEFPYIASDIREDYVQEAFFRALREMNRNLKFANPPENVLAFWLITTVRNICIDHFRRLDSQDRTLRKWFGGIGNPYVRVIGGTIIEAAVEDQGPGIVDLMDLIARSGLTKQQQHIVFYRHILDLSEEDTAANLGVSPGTVKTQLSRAIRKLRAALDVPPGGLVRKLASHPSGTTDAHR